MPTEKLLAIELHCQEFGGNAQDLLSLKVEKRSKVESGKMMKKEKLEMERVLVD